MPIRHLLLSIASGKAFAGLLHISFKSRWNIDCTGAAVIQRQLIATPFKTIINLKNIHRIDIFCVIPFVSYLSGKSDSQRFSDNIEQHPEFGQIFFTVFHGFKSRLHIIVIIKTDLVDFRFIPSDRISKDHAVREYSHTAGLCPAARRHRNLYGRHFALDGLKLPCACQHPGNESRCIIVICFRSQRSF